MNQQLIKVIISFVITTLIIGCSEPAGNTKASKTEAEENKELLDVVVLPLKLIDYVIDSCEKAAVKQRETLDKRLQLLVSNKSKMTQVEITLELAQIKWIPGRCKGIDKEMMFHYEKITEEFKKTLLSG